MDLFTAYAVYCLFGVSSVLDYFNTAYLFLKCLTHLPGLFHIKYPKENVNTMKMQKGKYFSETFTNHFQPEQVILDGETRLRSKVFSLEKTLVLTLLWILICGEGEVKSTHSPWPGFLGLTNLSLLLDLLPA